MTLPLLLNRLYTVTNCALVAAVLLKNDRATRLERWQHRWIDAGLLVILGFRLVALFVTTVYAAASVPNGGGFAAVLLTWLGLAGLLVALHLRPQPT